MVLHNPGIKHNVVTLSELSLAVCRWERLSRGLYYKQQHQSYVKFLNPAAMVDNLAKKVDTKSGIVNYCLHIIGSTKNCLLYGIVGCPLFRGCLSIEVNVRPVWTSRIVRYVVGVH